MTLTITITCNGITRTAKGTPFEVSDFLYWMKDLNLPFVMVQVVDDSKIIRVRYGKDL